MKAWPDGSAEPSAWNIDTVDGDITGGGWTGVSTYDYTDRPYYDYFSASANGQAAPSPPLAAGSHQITYWADNKAGAVTVTFDDGLISQYNLAVPALNARGFKGTFFAITNDVGSGGMYASWDQSEGRLKSRS